MTNWIERAEQLRAQQQADESKKMADEKAKLEQERVHRFAEQMKLIALKKQLINDAFKVRYGDLKVPEQLQEINQELWHRRGLLSLVGSRSVDHYSPGGGYDGDSGSWSRYYIDHVGYILDIEKRGEVDLKPFREGIAILFSEATAPDIGYGDNGRTYNIPAKPSKITIYLSAIRYDEPITHITASNFVSTPEGSRSLEIQEGLYIVHAQKDIFSQSPTDSSTTAENIESGLINAVAQLMDNVSRTPLNLERPIRKRILGIF